MASSASSELDHPGAERPARQYHLYPNGVGIAVHEWGDEDAPPLLLVHGGMDFARTYDAFAPKLAAAGWRVVGWDHRGHGDSDHAELYSWDADMRDALAVFDHVSPGRPVPVIGHSKGGALMTQLADAQSFRFSHLVNMDGIPWTRRMPDVAEHERTKMMADELAGWLDHRRRTATSQRKPGTLDELARRRGRMNPRLSIEWLRRPRDGRRVRVRRRMALEDRPGDALRRLRAVATGVDTDAPPGPADAVPRHPRRRDEEMGWGTPLQKVLPYMPAERPLRGPRRRRPLRPHRTTRSRQCDGVGLHRERLVTTETVVHGKIELALHHLRPATTALKIGTGTTGIGKNGTGTRPLLLLHGLGEASPADVPWYVATWPGPIAALDFTGHGGSTIPRGGGYTAEILLADADAALGALTDGDPTGDHGARARPRRVRRPDARRRPADARARRDPGRRARPRRRADGADVAELLLAPDRWRSPDPYALVELGRDLRPPDYAAPFVRLALAGSPLDEPIAVAAVCGPWLEAVAPSTA